jgi:hypothetical protein
MATYLPGMTDYIPEIQEFQPDFNFYAKSLQMSQSKYDANHDRLSNLYGSLLNSPMLREKNIEERDQFFKVIDQDIKKMSGMDLSKQQNVDSASAVFNQLLDNKSIVKDMVWTKNWQKQHQRADGFKNCVDPAKCGGAWWEDGVTALNYQAEEFKNATDDDAMNFGNAKFTPYQDVMGKAVKMAKDAGLSIKMDQKKGGYIITTKNGQALMKPLQDLFMGSLGKDPAIKDYYKTKAYVARKGWIQSKIPEYGSLEAAQQGYIDEITNQVAPKMKREQDQLDFTTENATKEREILEEKIRTQGTTEDSSLAQVYRDMVQEEAAYNSSLEESKEATGNLNVGLSQRATRATLANIDAAVGAGYLTQDINNAAQTLAWKDAEQTMRVDPYAMENVRQANRLSLEKIRFQNRKAIEGYKFDLKQFAKQQEARGGLTSNVPLTKDAMVGAVDVSNDPQAAWKEFQKDETQLRNEISAPEKEIAVEAMKLTQEKSKAQGGAANEDLVRVMDAVMKEFANPLNYKDQKQVGAIQKDPRFAKYNSMNSAQKLKFAQSFDFNKLEGLNGAVMDNIYDDEIMPMIDMGTATNQITRDYLMPLWKSSTNKRMDIKNKNLYLDNINNWYEKQTQDVKAKMRTNPEFEPYIDMIDALIDDRGNKKTKEEFARDYAEQMRAEAPATRPSIENEYLRGAAHAVAPGAAGMQVKVNKDDVYKQAYEEGLLAYDGFESEEFSIPAGIWGSILGGPVAGVGGVGAGLLAAEGDVPSTNIYELYKTGWAKYADPAGVPSYMKGVGSVATEKQMVFPTVDPAEALSVANMGMNGFIKDVLQADAGSRRVAMGGMTSELPERGADSETLAILNQYYTDFVTRTNPKDKSRPIFNMSYQNVAGGSSDWTALNIKIDDAYAKQFVGTEKNPGLFYNQRNKLTQNGMTLYLKKDAANNMLYKNAEKTSLDGAMDWAGQVAINDYPETTKNMVIKKKPTGGYTVTGSVLAGIDDQTGKQIWEPLGFDYNNANVNVNNVVNEWRQLLAKTEDGNRYLREQYLREKGITNPEGLLKQ